MRINPVAQRFAENMLIHRRRGFSQEEFGFRANLHRTEICTLEVVSHEAKITTIIKLAGALDVARNDLLAGIEWKAPPGLSLLGKLTVQE